MRPAAPPARIFLLPDDVVVRLRQDLVRNPRRPEGRHIGIVRSQVPGPATGGIGLPGGIAAIQRVIPPGSCPPSSGPFGKSSVPEQHRAVLRLDPAGRSMGEAERRHVKARYCASATSSRSPGGRRRQGRIPDSPGRAGPAARQPARPRSIAAAPVAGRNPHRNRRPTIAAATTAEYRSGWRAAAAFAPAGCSSRRHRPMATAPATTDHLMQTTKLVGDRMAHLGRVGPRVATVVRPGVQRGEIVSARPSRTPRRTGIDPLQPRQALEDRPDVIARRTAAPASPTSRR